MFISAEGVGILQQADEGLKTEKNQAIPGKIGAK
jgi:hypothetical protein